MPARHLPFPTRSRLSFLDPRPDDDEPNTQALLPYTGPIVFVDRLRMRKGAQIDDATFVSRMADNTHQLQAPTRPTEVPRE